MLSKSIWSENQGYAKYFTELLSDQGALETPGKSENYY